MLRTVKSSVNFRTVLVEQKQNRKPEEGKEENGKMQYSFDQPVPIQSYLIAIAAGAIVSKKIGPRSAILVRFVDF